MSARDGETGVVLVNVLVVLAIAGGLMLLLVNSQDAALDRVSHSADAAIVERIALGAEASVIDALRRDLDDAPDADHLNEKWALGVIQDEVQLPTGRFSVRIADQQAMFDINQLANVTAGTQDFARRLLIALDQPPETANQIGRVLSVVGRVTELQALSRFGISTEVIDAMAPFVTALPVDGMINLNTVDPFLLAVMLQNGSHATQLVRLRERQGSVSLEALRNIGALRPQNSGLTSNVYSIDILAESGAARMRVQTLVVRINDRGFKAVEILERRFLQDGPRAAEELSVKR